MMLSDRELLDHPVMSPLLEDLIGDPNLANDGLPSFRIDHIYSQRRRTGQLGSNLHGELQRCMAFVCLF